MTARPKKRDERITLQPPRFFPVPQLPDCALVIVGAILGSRPVSKQLGVSVLHPGRMRPFLEFNVPPVDEKCLVWCEAYVLE